MSYLLRHPHVCVSCHPPFPTVVRLPALVTTWGTLLFMKPYRTTLEFLLDANSSILHGVLPLDVPASDFSS